MSISLIAVFIPILMMGGIVGRLFREFAVILSVAIAISMVVSLTADADDVRVAAQGRPRATDISTTRPKNSSVDYLHVCVGARRRAGSSRVRPAGRGAHDGRQRLPLHQGPEGIFPAAGYRTSAAAPSWASSTSPTRRWWRRRSGSRSRSGRTRMSKPSPWWRAPAAADSAGTIGEDQRSAEAGGSSQVHLGPGDRPSAPQDFRRARRDDVPAELPGRAHRRPAGQRAISVHAAGAGLRLAGGMGTESSGPALDASGDRGRQLRPAEFRACRPT